MKQKKKVIVLEPNNLSEKARNLLHQNFETIEPKDLSEVRTLGREIEALFVKLKYKIDSELIQYLPSLKFVVSPTTGLTHIDLPYCQSKNIEVLCLKDEISFLRDLTATAELTWALLMASFRHIPRAFDSVKSNVWNRDLFYGNELKDKTIGIIGLGRLGVMVAQYAKAFRMRVLYSDPFVPTSNIAEKVDLDTLLSESDIISLHVHATPENKNMLGSKEFNKMRKQPLLVNTSRGELIDEAALLEALTHKKIRGACLDVLVGEQQNTPEEKERWIKQNPLIEYSKKNQNLLLTPHIGGLTFESVEKAEIFIIQKLIASFP